MDTDESTLIEPAEGESSVADDIRSAMNELSAEPEDTLSEPIEEVAEEEVEVIEPPQHWSEQDKALFKGAPPDVQRWMLDRHKSMEADHTRKTQEIADFKREYGAVREILTPFQEQMQSLNLSSSDVIQRWAQAEQYLQTSPAEAIAWLAENYGVDLSQLGQQSAKPGDPRYTALEQKLAALESNLTQRQQAEQKQKQQTILSQIQEFAGEKDGDQLKHPHFEAVMQDMVSLANAERSAGRAPDLAKLYETAIWANPTVREQLLADQRKASEQQALEAAKKKAAAARKAGSSITGAPSGGSAPASRTLREELEANFSAAS